MLPFAPLQFGVPGAMELAVVLLVAVIVFGVPLVVLAGTVLYLRRVERKLDRIESRLEDEGVE